MPTHRFVLCTDGTWNIPDQKDGDTICPSNVVKMAQAVAATDQQGVEQVVYYHKGVGTGKTDHLLGGAFGWGLSRNICDAYRFLLEQYEPGDEIFLFGFSRGAYTARSLAGLIRNCGVLRREHADQLRAAYNLYRRRDDPSHPAGIEAQLFRKTYAHDEVRITFIGVWDTVGSLGIPVGIPWLPLSLVQLVNKRWQFHDVKLSSYVDNAFHAVAIDERRRQFAPTLWQQQDHAVNQRMEQVWFAGVHSNIGGGYQDSGLSDLAFLWLVRKAEECGLVLDNPEALAYPNPLGVLRDSRILLYKLLPPRTRRMGNGSETNEEAHQSAIERRNQARDPAYHPANLADYLKRGGAIAGG